MTQETYYDLLELSPHASLEEINAAYLRISRELASGKSALSDAEAAFRGKLVTRAYEVLCNPARRADYDAGLVLNRIEPAAPLYVEVGLKSSRLSPVRILLSIIASVMVIGLVIQVGVMFFSYQRVKNVVGDGGNSPAAEKIYLQEIYQTYGIRAASRAEAELLLAEMRKKDEANQEERRKKAQKENEEQKLKRFEEESRRFAAEASENLRRAEQEAARQKEEEIRQKQEKERAERARIEQEMERLRSQYSPSR